MNAQPTINDCIKCDSKEEELIKNAEPQITDDYDPRIQMLRDTNIRSVAGKTVYQKGVLIINDGNDATSEVWKRLSLTGKRPIEVLDQQKLIDIMLATADIEKCISQATVLVVPQTAGARVLNGLEKSNPKLVEGKRVIAPAPSRELSAEREVKNIILSNEDALALSECKQDDRIVILDDVASTYSTAASLAKSMTNVRSCDLVTLVATNPKPEDMPVLVASGIASIQSAIVTQYKKLPDWRPAITTTGGMFDGTKNSNRSFDNLCRYIQNEGLALKILAERSKTDIKLLFMDLDGTALVNGKMSPEMQEVLTKTRSQLFSVIATSREYKQVSREVQSLFRGAIFDNGLSFSLNEKVLPSVKKEINVQELTNCLQKAVRNAKVNMKVTRKRGSSSLPWVIRIRDKSGDISNESFTKEDTESAIRLAGIFNKKSKKFTMQPSGFGDVSIAWSGSGKGTTGINALASAIPTLPPLSKAISAGDGPNDIDMLNRIREEGGISLAVNPVNRDVENAASQTTDTKGLVEYISSISE